jgi:putative endonuclease
MLREASSAAVKRSRSERTIAVLDRIASVLGRTDSRAKHLSVGAAGEEAALFHLRRLGYTILAHNWRTSSLRGDIDLVALHQSAICFIEVKSRSARSIVSAAFAVDDAKCRMLRRMARAWLRQTRTDASIPTRFDVVSVYFDQAEPRIEVLQDAFPWSENRG